jgi:hypothetical protein
VGYILYCEPTESAKRTDQKQIISLKFFYSPTDAQMSGLKNNLKIDIKTALTCFGAVTPSSRSALLVLAKVTVVKVVH